ncbi:MAG: hypothetical protein WCA55_15660 [Xanthobacteraceae bacterium]
MSNVTHYPSLIFALTFSALWLTAWAGVWLGKKGRELEADLRDDFGLILAATLTLLALIIGFSFSMATARCDQRKNYEEQEANAIGTEYVRADLLSPVEAAKVRSLLGSYLDQRVLFMMNKSYCRSAPALFNCKPSFRRSAARATSGEWGCR